MPTQATQRHGAFAIVRTAQLESGDELFYVPLITSPEDRKEGKHQEPACVRHNPTYNTFRCALGERHGRESAGDAFASEPLRWPVQGGSVINPLPSTPMPTLAFGPPNPNRPLERM